MFPTRSSLVKEPEAFAPAVEAFPSAAKRELTPAGSVCQQLFFVPRKFFFGAPRPSASLQAAQKRESIPLHSACQQFFQPVRIFSNPAANPSATPRQLEASFYPAPSRAACQQLIFREQKNNRLVAQQSPAETRTLATGTSVPQRRRRFMHLYSPPVNSFFAIFLLYFSLYNKIIMLYFQCSKRRTLRPSPDPSR